MTSNTYDAGEFSVVPGWFVYDEPDRNPASFSAIADNFGLIEGKTWKGLLDEIQRELYEVVCLVTARASRPAETHSLLR